MTEPKPNNLRLASSAEAASILKSERALTQEDLQAALINALERIAALENDWEEVGRACRWFTDQVKDSNQKA